MIREDGASTISVVQMPNGTIVAADSESGITVQVMDGRVYVNEPDGMTPEKAWSLRDVLGKALGATSVPA